MNLARFRDKVREYRRLSGYPQTALAKEIGLHPSVLSHKLNGAHNFNLTHPEIKQIIKTLIQWKTINTRLGVAELLQLVDLNSTAFSLEEWNSPPLSELEPSSGATTLLALSGEETTPTANWFEPAESALPSIETLLSPGANPKSRPEPPELSEATLSPRSNLPAQPTPLIGRRKEITLIKNLLHRTDVRLVTLYGSGGAGKTRLALQVATELLPDFEDGAFFVPLEAITEPEQVAVKLGQIFGLKSSPEESIDELLKEYLRRKRLLLVLDTAEQIAESAALISSLLANAPFLKIVLTSRILPHLYGEYEFLVPPLALPELTLRRDPEELTDCEAVALFVQRARMVKPDFNLTEEVVPLIAEICVRLDGLPLAIELAAARTKLLSLPQLLSRLVKDGPLGILTCGAPGRHQSLRRSLEWSYTLLEPEERLLFARLGIFEGSCTLDAIEKVCLALPGLPACTSPDGVVGLLDVLTALLDKSMLGKVGPVDGTLRFAMLKTVRAYALECLRETGELSRLQEKYAACYTQKASPLTGTGLEIFS